MSSSVYEEALADVKKLKEVAEQNAKNAIIDAVTPKIREMIEKQLIGETSHACGDVLSDLAESLLDGDADDVSLTSESLKALSNLVNEGAQFSAKDAELSSLLIQERLLIIMDETGATPPNIDALAEIKKEVVATYEQLVENRMSIKNIDFERTQKRLASLDHFLNEAIGENEMNERDLRSILDEEALKLVLDLGDAITVADDEEVEIDPAAVLVGLDHTEEAVEDLEALGAEAEAAAEELEAEEAEEVDPDAEVDIDIDVEDVEEVEEVEEVDETLEINEEQLANMIRSILNEEDDDEQAVVMGETDEQGLDEDDAESVEADPGSEQGPGGQSGDFPGEPDEGRMHESDISDDTVVEISEAMLRNELSRMRQLRESPRHTPTRMTNNKESNKKNNEAVRQVGQLKTQLREYKKAVSSLRSQLDESNLFNAKLLYANKLLQNRDLSDRQRVNIVESLDDARSLREVRLLYKSLTDSTGTNKGNLTESKRRRAAGSASRPTRTGSVSKESVPEADRWALLAGLNK